ncbi:MAG: hypothetical protein VCE74_11430 [Alphaproteobacteria bacterium]|jgi:hypothetical protein
MKLNQIWCRIFPQTSKWAAAWIVLACLIALPANHGARAAQGHGYGRCRLFLLKIKHAVKWPPYPMNLLTVSRNNFAETGLEI